MSLENMSRSEVMENLQKASSMPMNSELAIYGQKKSAGGGTLEKRLPFDVPWSSIH